MTGKAADYPLWQKYKIPALETRTGYSESHLMSIELGWREASDQFRRTMSTILGVPEAELFGEVA